MLIAYQIASYMEAPVDVNTQAQHIYKTFYGEKGIELLEKVRQGTSL